MKIRNKKLVSIITIFFLLGACEKTDDSSNQENQDQEIIQLDSLVGYWNFEGNSDNVILDLSESKNYGISDGVTIQTGIKGNGAYFDGNNSNVKLYEHDSYTPPLSISQLSTGSVSIWFKLDELPEEGKISPIFSFGTDSVEAFRNRVVLEVGHFSENGFRSLFFTLSNNHTTDITLCFSTKEDMQINKWYHFVGIIGEDFNTAYLNRQELTDRQYNFADASTRSFFNDVTDKDVFWLGKGAYMNGMMCHFKGMIDELRIYNKTLSATEIIELYNLTY